jgi:predicted Co/Zn/Cd cation transporter (cation efflux family)
LSGLSLLASWAAGLEPDEQYPFGRGAVIPVAILIQGAALGATLVYAAFDALSLILAGGSEGAPLNVVGYGLLTLLIAIGLTIALPRVAPRSELAAAEAAQGGRGQC